MIEYQTGKPLIQLNNVSVEYNGKVIIRDIGTAEKPFVINDVTRAGRMQGQTVAIIGRSGVGKSTLFKMLTGIEQPKQGTIYIPTDKEFSAYRAVKGGDVGYVQQNYPLSRNQTVYDMLMQAAGLGRIRKAERKDLIENYLQQWRLIDQRNNAARQLSGGQRQRVAIIEQLLCSHHFMVFDEPFSGLDFCNIQDVKASFNKIAETDDANTIIFSTHDIELAVELADQIFVLGYESDPQKGMLQGGTVLEMYDLKPMGLAWSDSFTSAHLDLVNTIKQRMLKS